MRPMKGFELNIGRACNSRCVFCVSRLVSPEEKAWLPLQKAKDEIRLAFEHGSRALGFLGGEPTIYPHLEEVILYGRELGYRRVALATNGLLLSRMAVVEKLIDAGVTRFGISIHSDLASVEDSLTRVKKAFERKVGGLKNLVKMREAGRVPDNVSVNPLLHTRILKRMPRMLRFFQGLGLDDVRFNSLRPVTGGKEDRALCPSFAQAMPLVAELIQQNEQELGMHLTFGDIPICAWPWQFLANRYLVGRYVGEHHDLETSVAIFRDAKSDEKSPDRFVWSDIKREELKAKLEVCSTCAWDRHCEGYWNTYLEIHGTDEIEPPPGVYPG